MAAKLGCLTAQANQKWQHNLLEVPAQICPQQCMQGGLPADLKKITTLSAVSVLGFDQQ